MSLLNIWGHITTVPACSSGTLTNVLPHMKTMLQTQDTTLHPITVHRHWANISLCYPLMWNVTQLPILMSWVRPHQEILPRPSTHTSKRSTLWCCYGGCQSEARKKVPYQPGLEPGTCGVRIHNTIRSPTAASAQFFGKKVEFNFLNYQEVVFKSFNICPNLKAPGCLFVCVLHPIDSEVI